MSDTPEFQAAGALIRKRRKEAGYKTQKAFIAELKARAPEVSCSESYISLIEKGVKTPGVHLLDVMAEVLNLSASEKGELLLTYKRVPSDFEFAVRDNLRASTRSTRLDELRERYSETPQRQSFNTLLKALILANESDEALELLKQAPTFENEVLELQERTAKIAALSGNESFARQAFELALANCKTPREKADILLHLGILHFQAGMKNQADILLAMDSFVQAHHFLKQSLNEVSDDLFAVDEMARCSYHLGDALLQLLRQPKIPRPQATQHRALATAFSEWFQGRLSREQLQARAQRFFEASRAAYSQVLSASSHSALPEKSMQEAVFFHAYVHGKLKLFPLARVLVQSNVVLSRNWLTLFMWAALTVMEYEISAHEPLLDEALEALSQALELDPDAVLETIRAERERELASLWAERRTELEDLIQKHENT